jgi:manganese transport protein
MPKTRPLQRFRSIGPGLLVTAAFIGPGTVTTATTAGAGFGYALLWAILFAIAATIVLQEMSARLGLISGQGLGEAIRTTFTWPLARLAACGLIVVAIGFGNAAYQTGNVTGSAVGLEILTGIPVATWSWLVGIAAGLLLFSGAYRVLRAGLIAMVIGMSAAFVVTAVLVRPDPVAAFSGAFVPQVPPGSLTAVVALLGTTIVPYNLFLHASSVRQHWPDEVPRDQALAESRFDTVLAIVIGGMITAAILTTAAAAFYPGTGQVTPAEMARQLSPSLGSSAATVLFSLGLLAAGLTSAVTAPLAAGFAVAGAVGWPAELASWRVRGVSLAVLLIGTILAALLGKSPTQTIVVAQVANGLLLPLVAVFLLIAVNRRSMLGRYANGWLANLAGGTVVAITTVLAVWKLATL